MEQDSSSRPDPAILESALTLLVNGAESQGFEHDDIRHMLIKVLVRHSVGWDLGVAFLPPIWEDIGQTLDGSIARQKSFVAKIKPPP